MEQWAPAWAAWERDNVGIQIGRVRQRVKRILVTLDVTAKVVDEADRGSFDLIVSHHPLLFHQPKRITDQDVTGRLVLSLAQRNIAVFSMHTNLDAAKGGVSFALAETLGLVDVQFLSPLADSLVKLAVFVPEAHASRVRNALTHAGAGVIGDYSSCSFESTGTGTFQGSGSTSPFVGTPGHVETTNEIRLEMICPKALVAKAVEEMKKVHPCEEVAYDIYPLANPNPNFGMGAIGTLRRSTTLKQFINHTKRSLHAAGVRYAGSLQRTINRVAVCGGSGSDLFAEAERKGADVFVSADVRYHTFQLAEHGTALIDAGHYETEQVILPHIVKRLKQTAKNYGESLTIKTTVHHTNPIHWA
ncbi:MAG: Nif3-like dinuclear metal center hexameric protein [Ignavibacteriales bacterium]|nr:Nif3-like dinuclear metal center hexameric protein [Ignavibacteriales bacterium]